jgi:hypothetical protein
VTAGWVAASTRGNALLRRLVGPEYARQIAESDSWPEARDLLAASFYATDMPPGFERETARRAAATATIWQLRVLAGWFPVGGSGLARLFAAPIEIANIEAHVAGLNNATIPSPIPLGSLAIAWPRVKTARSVEAVRAALINSPWGDPGGTDPVTIAVGLRVAWARRHIRTIPESADWGKAALAVLVARELFAFERDLALSTSREVDRLVGTAWRKATTIPDLAAMLPKAAARPLRDISTPAELWTAEQRVVEMIATDAAMAVAAKRCTKKAVAAIMALLLVDLRRVTAAIEIAGRGPNPSEAFDAVA